MLKILIGFIAFTLVSCSHYKVNIEKSVFVGENLKSHRMGKIYFSGAPSPQDLRLLKEQGFTDVIDLQRRGENSRYDERNAVKKAGMTYHHRPFPKDMVLNDTYIKSISKALDDALEREGKVLIHCTTGNRAAMWLGGYLFLTHDIPKNEAFNKAIEVGMTKKKAMRKLDYYLEK